MEDTFLLLFAHDGRDLVFVAQHLGARLLYPPTTIC